MSSWPGTPGFKNDEAGSAAPFNTVLHNSLRLIANEIASLTALLLNTGSLSLIDKKYVPNGVTWVISSFKSLSLYWSNNEVSKSHISMLPCSYSIIFVLTSSI